MPVYITAKDFDGNGSYDAFPSLFLPATHDNPQRKEFPAHIQDDATTQLVSLRVKFQSYKAFAKATMDDLFTPEQRKRCGAVEGKYTCVCFNTQRWQWKIFNDTVTNAGTGFRLKRDQCR